MVKSVQIKNREQVASSAVAPRPAKRRDSAPHATDEATVRALAGSAGAAPKIKDAVASEIADIHDHTETIMARVANGPRPGGKRTATDAASPEDSPPAKKGRDEGILENIRNRKKADAIAAQPSGPLPREKSLSEKHNQYNLLVSKDLTAAYRVREPQYRRLEELIGSKPRWRRFPRASANAMLAQMRAVSVAAGISYEARAT